MKQQDPKAARLRHLRSGGVRGSPGGAASLWGGAFLWWEGPGPHRPHPRPAVLGFRPTRDLLLSHLPVGPAGPQEAPGALWSGYRSLPRPPPPCPAPRGLPQHKLVPGELFLPQQDKAHRHDPGGNPDTWATLPLQVQSWVTDVCGAQRLQVCPCVACGTVLTVGADAGPLTPSAAGS